MQQGFAPVSAHWRRSPACWHLHLCPHGELLRRSFSDGELLPSATETYQYDEYGNLQSIPGLVTNINRTATFEPLVTTYANGVTETRSYDPNRQWLLSITSSNSGGTIFTESYTRNNKGLITNVASNRANGNWTYGYDTAYRLISATNLDSSSYTQTFHYDAADNITYNSQVGSYTYPSPVAAHPHAVTQAGNLIYAYDANGNLTSGGGRTIAYDGEERPTVVTALGQTTSFVYGPESKRLKKTSAGDTTLYLGDDEEITPSGERIKHPYSDVRKVGTTINWMQRDHLSSVRLMTDASGAVISENHFRPYGERTDVQVSLTVPRESKGWIGERDDPETGLTYLNARYYDPVLARFVSPDWFDPKKIGVGTNRYAYGGNNPIAHKDPSGNAPNKAGAADSKDIEKDISNLEKSYNSNNNNNNNNKGTSPEDVQKILEDLAARKINNKNRYFYTERFGWVDARHFGKAASLSYGSLPVGVVEALGFVNEVVQTIEETYQSSVQGKSVYSSGFSSEDLASNRAGAEFGKTIGPNDTVANAFGRWSGNVGARSKSDPKSGFNSLPAKDPSNPANNQGGWESNSSNNVNSSTPDDYYAITFGF